MSYCALTFVDTSFHACAGLDMDFCLSLVCLYMHVPPFLLFSHVRNGHIEAKRRVCGGQGGALQEGSEGGLRVCPVRGDGGAGL